MHPPLSDGERLLLRYHERYPGATARALSGALDEGGRSSYQLLVDDAAAVSARRILDLGCGDGYLLEQLAMPGRSLVGVDMSTSELAAARQRLGDRFNLVEARASALPFVGGSFDAVVSHLALMLMERLDAVLAEVARVLRPGGYCCAVVSVVEEKTPTPALRVFSETWLETMRRKPHDFPSIGDPRARSLDGFASLFAAAGFDEFAAEEVIVRRFATAPDISHEYGLYYFPAALEDNERDAFVDDLTKALGEAEHKGEKLAFVTQLLHLRARVKG